MINFKTFLDEILLEGGAALKTSPVTQSEALEVIPKIIAQVADQLKIKKTMIKKLGSAGEKPEPGDTSGDIDLAVRAEAEDVEKALPTLAYDGKTFRIMKGINVYSFAYDLGEKKVQVDLMPVKSPLFAAWASQANKADLAEGLKGSHRNELFFAVAKHLNPEVLKRDVDNSPLVIKRFFYDLHKGLMIGVQTREGKKKSSKNFRTVEKKLVTDNPIEVTKMLFGEHATPDQVSTFKGTLAAINSARFPNKSARKDILEMAREGMKKKGLKVPSFL